MLAQISPSPLNPLGVKGVGECGVIPAAAAIISAAENALQPFAVRIDEVPLFPQAIMARVEEAKARIAAN